MEIGETVTKMLIWAALAAYVATLALMAGRSGTKCRSRQERWLWTLACAALWAHVAAAFQFYHHWSHSAALAQTAAETAAVVGIDWGGGIWFNYLLLTLWTVDAGWWWIQPASYVNRPRWITVTVQGFLAFMMFNAVIVFESGPLRFIGLAAVLLLLAIWLANRTRRRTN